MDNPHLAELPAHMSEFVSLPDNEGGDWGGVHINMSIPCLAYVRMVDGEPHFTRNNAYKVWYRALTTYLNANSDFMNARSAVLQAAQDIYGGTPEWTNIECGIKNAFASVGLGADCSGGGGEWEGDYLYYWNPDAADYYAWYLPDPEYDIFGYAIKFTMPTGYNLAGIFAGVFDVWTLADMFMGIYNSGLSLVYCDTITNDELWTAVYGGGSGTDSATYVVGVIVGQPFSGDFYAVTWLIGDYDPYTEYITLASDDATGNTQERNYTLDSYGYIYPIRTDWGAEYNLIFFAAITREANAGETTYLLPNGKIFDVRAYPTPFNSVISIDYSIPGEGKINITDISGRLVQSFDNLSGDGTLIWNADNNLPTGVYFVNAHSNSLPAKLSRRIVYIR